MLRGRSDERLQSTPRCSAGTQKVRQGSLHLLRTCNRGHGAAEPRRWTPLR
jgi:hypothetical protein